jgi:hypothetical protein
MHVQPDPIKLYIIEIDSSDFANGMTLYQQDDDGKLHPAPFDGFKLYGAELRYTMHEKDYCQYKMRFGNGTIRSNYGDHRS